MEFNGLKKAVEESLKFDKVVKKSYDLAAEEIYGGQETPGIACFAYGSPGRLELIGGDSDADVFLVEDRITEKSRGFKRLFTKILDSFDFSKVDMPDWGSFEEIDTYLAKSMVEGNQVLETRFLTGDLGVANQLAIKKNRFNSVERGLKNIVFNRLYFNQYFRQRVRNGSLNLKYCNGGSRDFLFVYWHDRLDRLLLQEPSDDAYKPKIEQGLERLYKQGTISGREFEEAIEATNFIMNIRADILKLNKNSTDRGLTQLDDDVLKKLETLGHPPLAKSKELFESSRKSIDLVANKVWTETMKKAELIYGQDWAESFRRAHSSRTSYDDRNSIPYDDPLMAVALIWGASESNQKQLFDYLADKYKSARDWSIIGSLVCSPLCSPEVLHHFGTGQLKEKGYGYLLRVVARNPNVTRDTLEAIASDGKLEKRYTEIASAALKEGNVAANNQI